MSDAADPAPRTRAEPRLLRPTSVVLGIGAALMALVLLAATAAAYLLREREVEAWSKQLSTLSLVVAEEVGVNLSSAQLVLEQVTDMVDEIARTDPQEFAQRVSTRPVFQVLTERSHAAAHIDVVTVVDDSGKVLNFSRSYPPPPIDLADRDYFQAQRASSKAGLFIGASVRNRGNGQWVFYLSRRINGPQKNFMGLVLVGISVQSLTDFHGRLGANLGRDASISLLRDDFTMLARWPPNDTVIGKRSLKGSTQQVIEEQGRKEGVVLIGGPRLDGSNPAERMAAVRTVDKFPLVVNVTATSDLYLAGWRNAVTVIVALALLAAAVVLASTALLYRLIARREADLERLRELKRDADQANDAKSYFVAAVSHELRTPLNGVLGMADIIADGELPPEQRRNVEILRSSASSLLRTVDDVLDFSKVEAGKLELRPRDFSLKHLLRDLHDLFSTRASAKGLLFSMKLAEGVPDWVRGDPERLYQILGNYLGNALKFTEQGQIGLYVLPVAAPGVEHRVRFSVTDTGIGIPREAQGKLFEPFTQADRSSTRRVGGTGLGLAISRQLANLMGAHVGFESSEGTGSHFWIEVPLPPAAHVPSPEEAGEQLAMPPNPGARVLVAEDNATNQLVAERLLRMIGLNDVTLVANGQEALQRLAGERFDLVLMDCHMPVMDGYQATRRLRKQGMAVPVIAMTANALPEDRQRCLDAGMNDHIPKPVAMQVLQEAVYRWLPRVLDARGALARLERDEPLYRQVLETALRDIPAQVDKLRLAAAGGRNDEALRFVHAIKGTAGTAGAAQLAMLAASLQARIETAGPEALTQRAVDELDNAATEFGKAATVYLEGASATA